MPAPARTRPASSSAPTPAAPSSSSNGSPATGSGSDSGHVTIAGRKVSYDSLAIVGGGLLGTWLLLKSRSGSSSGQAGTVVAVPTAPSSAQQVDASALFPPPSSAAPTPGPDLVSSLYGTVLNRTGDPSGTAYWEQYSATHTQQQTTAAFLSTPEAQVQTDYQTYLGRYADPGGLAFYTGQINAGMTPAQVQAEFAYAAAHGAK